MKAKFDENMSMEDYLSCNDFLSKSMLATILDCPARFKYVYIDGGKKKETKSLRIGSAAHTLALEPENWVAEYHVTPETYIDSKGNTKPWRHDKRMAVVKEEIERAEDKLIITHGEFRHVEGIASAISKNNTACELLKDGFTESTILWQEDHMKYYEEFMEEGILKFKCRPDYMRDNGIIVDLKTTQSVKPSNFFKDAYNYYYDISAALTCRGYSAINEGKDCRYVFIAVETEPPYLIEIYDSSEPVGELIQTTYIEHGEYRLNEAINRYLNCRFNDSWPVYSDGRIQAMGLPSWRMREIFDQESEAIL